MTRQGLIRIIQRAVRGKITDLDLNGKRLIELPPEIGQLTQLQQLNLS
jgi:internalin A